MLLLRTRTRIETGIAGKLPGSPVKPVDPAIPGRHPKQTAIVLQNIRDKIVVDRPFFLRIVHIVGKMIVLSVPVPQPRPIRTDPDVMIRILAKGKDEIIDNILSRSPFL